MSIGNICRREVHLAAPDTSVQEVARRMRDGRVGTLVVLDDARRPMGLVTDRDLVVRVVADARDVSDTPASAIMTTPPKVVHELTSVEDTLALMRAGALRRVPVVDDDGALVGIVSLDDVLQLLSEEFEFIGGLLAREDPLI